MSNQENIKKELEDLNSSLSFADPASTYIVPDGYFDGLPATILAKLSTSTLFPADEIELASPFLAGIPKKMPYSVPLSYFDDNVIGLPWLTDNESSELLQKIGQKMPLFTPANYFQQLPETILARVTSKAKVFSIPATSWLKYAVAAMIAGVIFTSGYQYYTRKSSNSFAGIPVKADSLNRSAYDERKFFTELKSLPPTIIKDFINTIESVSNNSPDQLASSEKEVKHLLQDVSDKDMESFLNQFPSMDDDLGTTN